MYICSFFCSLVASVKKWTKLQLTNLIKFVAPVHGYSLYDKYLIRSCNFVKKIVREKLNSNTRSHTHGEKMSNLFKTHVCLVFTFFSSAASVRKWAKLLLEVSLIFAAPDFDYPLYKCLLKSSDFQKELDSKASRTRYFRYQMPTKETCG